MFSRTASTVALTVVVVLVVAGFIGEVSGKQCDTQWTSLEPQDQQGCDPGYVCCATSAHAEEG